MSKIREYYKDYINTLKSEGIEEGIDLNEYAYMYSLYLEKNGIFTSSEEELNEGLEIIESLGRIDFEDVRELGEIVAPKDGILGLEEEIKKSEVEFERFNVTSRENEREYIEVDCGIVSFDINKFLIERTNLKVKDGFKIVVYRIKNNFEDKYKLIAFRNFGMDYLLNEECLVDTYYEGINLEFKNGDNNFLKYIKGNGSLESYIDVVEISNEINNLSLDKEEILYGEKRYLTNKFIPNEPTIYKIEDKIYLEYVSIKNENGEYSEFLENIILFNKGEYDFKKFSRSLGRI